MRPSICSLLPIPMRSRSICAASGRAPSGAGRVAAAAAPAPRRRGPLRVEHLACALRTSLGKREVSLLHLPLSWNGAWWPFRHPLDFIGSDGGGGVGGGPGISVGAALALKGSGRLPVSICGDGDFLMGVTALWTAVHYRIPLLLVVANNRSFYNDEVHQERVARMRDRPVENKWIGQRMTEPDIDLAALARAQGALGLGPITIMTSSPRLCAGYRRRRAGAVAVVDVRVEPGYAPAMTRHHVETERVGDHGATPTRRSTHIGTSSQRPADDILVVDDLVKQFDTPDGPIFAVEHVSFGVRQGEFLSVIGPSGCGKSTVFNIIGGLLPDYQGRVTIQWRTDKRSAQIDRHGISGRIDLPLAHGARQRLLPARDRRCGEVGAAATARTISSRSSVSPASRTAIRPNCRAACVSV